MQYRVLGEIYVLPKTAIRYAKLMQRSLYELTLYIVHGLLHLLAMMTYKKKIGKKMRKKEKEYMALLTKLQATLT